MWCATVAPPLSLLTCAQLGINPSGIKVSDSERLLVGTGEERALFPGQSFYLVGYDHCFQIEGPTQPSQDRATIDLGATLPDESPASRKRAHDADTASDEEAEPLKRAAPLKDSSVPDQPTPARSQPTLLSLGAASVSTSAGQWRTFGTVVAREFGPSVASAKWATFDMDGTLIKPKGGRKFPRDSDDWEFAFPQVPARLRRLSSDGCVEGTIGGG